MQDDVRDERVDVANRLSSSPQRKIGIGGGITKKSVTEPLHDDDHDVRLLLEKASQPIHWNPATFVNIIKLNLPECGLSSLPTNLGKWLPNLSILFCPKNNFQELPSVIGSCPNLQVRIMHYISLLYSVHLILLTLSLSLSLIDGFVQVQWNDEYSSRRVATTVTMAHSDRQCLERNSKYYWKV